MESKRGSLSHGMSAERVARAFLSSETAPRLLGLLEGDAERPGRLRRDRRSSARQLLDGPGGALEEAALLLRFEEAARALDLPAGTPPSSVLIRSRWRLIRTLAMTLEARPTRRTTLPARVLHEVLSDLEEAAALALDLIALRRRQRPDPWALEQTARTLETHLARVHRSEETGDFEDLHQAAARLAARLAPVHDPGLRWHARVEAAAGLTELSHRATLGHLRGYLAEWRGALQAMLAAAVEDTEA